MKSCELIVSYVHETLLLGAILATVCKIGCIIYLHGHIGVGKSVICKGFLRKLGYTGHINSPTYNLIQSYLFTNKYVCHFDFYRLTSSEEVECIGIEEYFNNNTICLIEWPKKMLESVIPKADVMLTINYFDLKESRKITMRSGSALGDEILDAFLKCWKLYT
ncbi:tRNA (adenosine(37)-N6)-threonylcarbamoyltransferase complex ATPase subunit type 1 TsaE [Candidatus Blochmannia ocreatus (nom. nud.)]|uniref:tRNA threonylcarbamoyladenosine biosynthesis protein TsaE n=1 Tax=Candidatus Blochmannia ocreatus (nom. nud.) TaxID=251538 RepID=A0ABY4SUL7_9ENTR|nr:tRNA (adenosine(37)-N6)-threonylcarbamoyltransferase complex ATPase subunit type 1 TsaE [Candidatus Blochmannia ocreatus]URJ25163.1 tRNA (adenosine(37)-N6)-threonylcarbamoyltransferase complex ATPase subunit type 1 TsaE [Candidatus Blochmannia ocreatus]